MTVEQKNGTDNNNDFTQQRTPISEWITAVLGAALVLSTIGFMLYQATQNQQLPPAVMVKVGGIEQLGGIYVVQVNTYNLGDKTAASVKVEGILTNREGRQIETSEAELDYVPSHSIRQAGLFFTHDPKAYTLAVRATGFQVP